MSNNSPTTTKEDPLHRLNRTPTKASRQQEWAVWKEAERQRTRPIKEWGKSSPPQNKTSLVHPPSPKQTSPQKALSDSKSSPNKVKKASSTTAKGGASTSAPKSKPAKAAADPIKPEPPSPVKRESAKGATEVPSPPPPDSKIKQMAAAPAAKGSDDGSTSAPKPTETAVDPIKPVTTSPEKKESAKDVAEVPPPPPLSPSLDTPDDKKELATESSTGTASTAIPQTKHIQIPDKETAMALFDSLDENASGKLSLAELDKGVVTLFPDYNHKPAIMQAYKAADRSGNGFVERSEFGYFLQYLVHYNNLWTIFAMVDSNGDRRITREEFVAAADELDVDAAVFDEIDENKGGMILFGELVQYLAKSDAWNEEDLNEIQEKLNDTHVEDEATANAENVAPPPPPEPVPKAIQQIQIPDKETGMKLFDTLDENASGKLSLAELDKGVVNLFPEWNNKPAIMAAYKAADRSGNGFVERKEFGYFLRYLVYYNNLWKLFAMMDADSDRRISKQEFVAAAEKLDLPRDADVVFDEIDENGGGMILFGELVHWMASWSSESD